MSVKTNFKYWVFTFLLVLNASANLTVAQSRNSADSLASIFSMKDMQEIVLRNHPIVKQAALLSLEAKAKVMTALGNFDPSINASFSRKNFGGTEYYNHWDSKLKVPLWVAGADLNIGYDRNVGVYNNPETQTSRAGLTGLGLSIPLGQGFFIDARRSTLRQSKIMVDYAEAEKIKQINNVWYNAGKDYWNWYYAYQQYVHINNGVNLAYTRFLALRQQVLLGDKPPIDSVEAAITVQDRRVQLQSSTIELQNTRLLLSNNLWDKDGKPQELPENAVPENDSIPPNILSSLKLDSLVSAADDRHPDLLKLRRQGEQLNVERRYRQEMLKPKLNVTGSFLSSRRDFWSYVPDSYDFRIPNYKVGIDLSFPFFLRAERGKLREIKIQQSELEYNLEQTGREISTNIFTSFNELKGYQSQLSLQTQNVTNQKILVSGELQKFAFGESTLFLINSRESKLIDMQIKRAEIISSFQKSLATFYYNAGTRQIFSGTSFR
jgi:outer membrane protein TolC